MSNIFASLKMTAISTIQTDYNMTEKLQKVLARAGFGSRREIETWIAKGRIKVNGKVAVIGDRVGDDDKVVVDGKKLAPQKSIREERRVILYNKPEDEVSTRDDPEGRRTVFDSLPPLKHGRWVSVGVSILTPVVSCSSPPMESLRIS